MSIIKHGSSIGVSVLSLIRSHWAEVNPWYLVDIIRPAFHAYDRHLAAGPLQSVLPPDHHLVALDIFISKLRARSVFHPHGFYPQGFGQTSLLPRISREMCTIQQQLHEIRQLVDERANSTSGAGSADVGGSVAQQVEDNIPEIDVTLQPSEHGRSFANVLEGSFDTPAHCREALPPASLRSRFQLITPTSWSKRKSTADASLDSSRPPASTATARMQQDAQPDGGGGSNPSTAAPYSPNNASSNRSEKGVSDEMSEHRPVVILLPGTGEQGFRRRRHCVSYPLARLGIGSLILEGPYYGSRRPPEQRGSKLATLTDLPLLGWVTIQEARSLVKWLRRQEDVVNLHSRIASNAAGLGDSKQTIVHQEQSSAAVAATAVVTNMEDINIHQSGDCFAPASSSASSRIHLVLDSHRDAVSTRDEQISSNRRPMRHLSDADTKQIAQQAIAAADERRDSTADSREAVDWVSSGTPHPGSRIDDVDRSGARVRQLPAEPHNRAVRDLRSHDSNTGFGAITLAGTSMGGLHAAMAASLLPYGVGVASWLGPPSATGVFTQGRLAHGTDWDGLARDVDDPAAAQGLDASLSQLDDIMFEDALAGGPTTAPTSPKDAQSRPHSSLPTAADAAALHATFAHIPLDTLSKAQLQAARLLRITDITNFRAPERPDAAVFVCATQDQYVPLDARTMAMWDWVEQNWRKEEARPSAADASSAGGGGGAGDGCEVRQVRGGHVSASIFSLDSYAGMIVEVIRKLAATRGAARDATSARC